MKGYALIFACTCFASASRIATEEQVSEVADELQDASFVQLETEKPEETENRTWNHFKGLAAKAKSSCSCPMGEECECCFAIPFLGYHGCLRGKMIEGKTELQLTLASVVLVKKEIAVDGKEEVCGALPKAMSALSFCLNIASDPIVGGIRSCAGIDFRLNGQVGAAMNFQCLEARGGTLSMDGYAQVTQGGLLSFNIKSPFVAFTQAFKNKRAH